MSDIPIPDAPETPTSRTDGILHRLQPALALVIAFAAIGLALWEGIENRKHNRLSVRPKVAAAIDAGKDTTGEYVRMTIESDGLGPAVVQTFRTYFDGAPQDSTPWANVLDAIASGRTQVTARAFGRGHYFPAGRQYLLFEARRPAHSGEAEALADITRRLAIQICYCSMYYTDCDEVLLATVQVNTLPCAKE